MPAPRDHNVFYNLVVDEPSTTELLGNLMRFDKFRHLLLASLLTEECASLVEFEDIRTRTRLEEGDSPDVVIDNSEIYAFIEVKVDPWRKLTERQQDGRYLKALSESSRPRRWLVFLVPDNWMYRDKLEKLLGGRDVVRAESGIRTRILVWKKDVLDVIERNGLQELNPIFDEFVQLLLPWFSPILISRDEARMLVSQELGEAVWKLYRLVGAIQNESKHRGYKRSKALTGEIYFRNSRGQDVLWFGVWPEAWKKTGSPLCFGVKNDWRGVDLNSFRSICKDATEFESGKETWTLSFFSEEALMSEDVIWQQLDGVLQVMLGA